MSGCGSFSVCLTRSLLSLLDVYIMVNGFSFFLKNQTGKCSAIISLSFFFFLLLSLSPLPVVLPSYICWYTLVRSYVFLQLCLFSLFFFLCSSYFIISIDLSSNSLIPSASGNKLMSLCIAFFISIPSPFVAKVSILFFWIIYIDLLIFTMRHSHHTFFSLNIIFFIFLNTFIIAAVESLLNPITRPSHR